MKPVIHVLAGVNGAGKSSVGGAILGRFGVDFYNPDSFARGLVQDVGMDPEDANGRAWSYGRSQLEAAITEGRDYAFETTLGGNTIRDLLHRASATHDVHMIFVGLASVALHLDRVARRVASGGHPIPEGKIRERWDASRRNLCSLMPALATLVVFDNSDTVGTGERVRKPRLILNVRQGRVLVPDPADPTQLAAVPDWAKAIVEAALTVSG